MDIEVVEALHARLTRIEEILATLVTEKTHQEFYSTSEAAERLGKAEFTVREWCRLGRVRAQKRLTGRGRSHEWMISNEEIIRIRNEGLLPVPKPRIEY
jgi:transposase